MKRVAPKPRPCPFCASKPRLEVSECLAATAAETTARAVQALALVAWDRVRRGAGDDERTC